MATIDLTINGQWTVIAEGPGMASVTSYMTRAKFATGPTLPTLNPNVAGHILPSQETVTIPLKAGEKLYVHGDGHVTVDVDV